MSSNWKPARSIAECNALMSAPGQMLEMEDQIIDGRVLRVYKNLWPNLRSFFFQTVKDHGPKECIVFENDRLTFNQVHDQALRFAGVLKDSYGVKKGDRVSIVSRNYPEFICAFWGVQIIGGVSVCANAMLPRKALHYSINLATPKVVIMDPERAAILDLDQIRSKSGTRGFLIFRPHESPKPGKLEGIADWGRAVREYKGDIQALVNNPVEILPEDNATIFYTSGTTGFPKGVLSTQRSFLTNVFNALNARVRSFLRKGEQVPQPDPTQPQKGTLISVPLFHVTGLTALTTLTHLTGNKIILMRKWDPVLGANLIKKEGISVAGGVPSMVADIIDSPAAGHLGMDSFLFGGAPAQSRLPLLARKAFPNAMLSQAYGMTEANSVAVGFAGEDYAARPTAAGLPTLINDIVIVQDGKVLKPGQVGEIWIRGANIMREYWNDPKATNESITADGWYKSGDLGTFDEEGFLYIKDRIKDIIIRGGENIDSVSVENAFYADDRVMEVAAVGVPDERLGELVAVVVTLKPKVKHTVTGNELIAKAAKSLPRFAVPVIAIIQEQPLERNPAGKILKPIARKTAAAAWEKKRASLPPAAKL